MDPDDPPSGEKALRVRRTVDYTQNENLAFARLVEIRRLGNPAADLLPYRIHRVGPAFNIDLSPLFTMLLFNQDLS